MQFKKFEAATIEEALAAVKKDIGPDAMIVSTREITGHLFKKPRIEIVAGLDTTSDIILAQDAPDEHDFDSKLDPLRRELRALKEALKHQDTDYDAENLRQELYEIRNSLSQMQPANHIKNEDHALRRLLLIADIDPAFVEKIMRLFHDRVSDTNLSFKQKIDVMQEIIPSLIPVRNDFFEQHEQRIIALVGPTGVGKTTTIAKIAAHAVLNFEKSVLFITLDTYRIGAFEQLRYYANLIGIDIEIASSKDKLKQIIRNSRDYDMIFIDTAGRNMLHDGDYCSELSSIFQDNYVECYLTLSAATRRFELRQIVESFANLNIEGIILTKLDEAVVCGAVLNACELCQVPIFFVTTGQRVPEDLAMPQSNLLAEKILHSRYNFMQHSKTTSYQKIMENKNAN